MKPSDHSLKIILLIGLPASGKTTWTKQYIAQNPDTVVVSSDDILDRYAAKDGISYGEAFHKYRDTADTEFKAELKQAVLDKKNIIVDRTNLTKKARARIMGGVPKQYEKIAVVFSVDRSELDRRAVQREYETGKKIPKDIVDHMQDKLYVAPTKDEGFSEIITA